MTRSPPAEPTASTYCYIASAPSGDERFVLNPDVCREYRAGLRKLGSFNTIESFWKHYLYMKRPSHLENNVNLYLFRDGANIAPMWEVRL